MRSPRERTRLAARCAVLAALLAAAGVGCGGDDPPPAGGIATTTPAGEGANGASTTAVGGEPPVSDTTVPAGDGGGGAAAATTDPSSPTAAPPPDLPAAEICALVPAAAVEAALGVAGVAASPGAAETPQCTYRFVDRTGVPTSVTVAALRTEGDLEGKVGADAFASTLEANRAIAPENTIETAIDVGDQSIVLSTPIVHMAIVQFGGRVVTVLVGAGAGDVAGVATLAGATAALAP